jgi:hypothetical protein
MVPRLQTSTPIVSRGPVSSCPVRLHCRTVRSPGQSLVGSHRMRLNYAKLSLFLVASGSTHRYFSCHPSQPQAEPVSTLLWSLKPVLVLLFESGAQPESRHLRARLVRSTHSRDSHTAFLHALVFDFSNSLLLMTLLMPVSFEQ